MINIVNICIYIYICTHRLVDFVNFADSFTYVYKYIYIYTQRHRYIQIRGLNNNIMIIILFYRCDNIGKIGFSMINIDIVRDIEQTLIFQ